MQRDDVAPRVTRAAASPESRNNPNNTRMVGRLTCPVRAEEPVHLTGSL